MRCGGCSGSEPLRFQALVLAGPEYDVDLRHSQSCPGSGDIIHVLDRISRGSRDIWIVSRHTANLWLRCGFWAAVEDEHIRLCMTPKQSSYTDHDAADVKGDRCPRPGRTVSASLLRRQHERGRGYINTTNPPCIARFCFAGQSTWCTWVDLDNYGLDRNIVARDAGDQAAKIAARMREYITVLRKNDMGSLQTTIAAQAWYGFRRAYKRHALYVHQHRRASEIEEEACHGGRTECRYIGALEMPLWYVDVRGMYADIGRNCALPSALMMCTTDVDERENIALTHADECIAQVVLTTPQPAFPCRTQHGTVYPTGRFTTCLAGPELRMAAEHGYISDILGVARYKMSPVLQVYMDELLISRTRASADCDVLAEGVLKRLCNAVTGKFAQRQQSWEPRPDVVPPVQYGTWYGSDCRGETGR